ncbi:MAG TPA: beta-L-arabinofuranosidase domain-containing protein [Gemmatimonadaceae bacterium]|nr:beta-L-arabinofuranosidase domain-containing protein [Gemmatimonadaceae bacterium]
MTISRRTALKLGLTASAVPLLDSIPFGLANATERGLPGPSAEQTIRARSIPLHRVRLEGGPLKHAQELDIAYLLKLEPDRMLAYYRERAGLTPKAQPYGGWDGDGRNLTGHIAGHHLSAISLMWAATGDRRFKDRVDYMINELKVVQDKNGDGYLCALEHGRRCFGELKKGQIRAAAFDLNGEWSPWYTLHKLFAGLRDAYRYTGNRTALHVETNMGTWAEGVLAGLDDAQIQHMLETEFGGMNEVLVDLAKDTGDARWLRLSYDFEHRAFVRPLQRHQDDLGGKHANCSIPKLIGSAHRFIDTGRAEDLLASSFFWDSVTGHHSFATGGSGTDEYWGPADMLGSRIDGRTDESCPVYNMLKLSRLLFAVWPDVHYADYQERMLFNHALGSIDPNDGRMCYMVPIGQGVTHEYQDMFHAFTCCVGTGMENHALHGDGLYFEDGKTLWWNQFVPSTASWDGAGVQLNQASDFPMGETATLTMTLASPREFTLAVRRPYWVGDGFAVKVNGTDVTQPATDEPARLAQRSYGAAANDAGATHQRRDPYFWPVPVGSYVEVKRTWKSGDRIEVALPKTLRLEPTPDNPSRTAIMWGPLVLSGDLGPEPARGRGQHQRVERPAAPVFVAADQPVDSWLEPVAGQPGHFRTKGVGREPTAEGTAHDVELMPFYQLQERSYGVYWDLYTPDGWTAKHAEYQREAAHQRMLEAASVAFVEPGDRSAEQQFNYQSGDRIQPAFIQGRRGRAGRSWFSYDLAVDPAHPMAVVATYYSADRRTLPASFQILVDGQQVGTEHLERSDPGQFFDKTYPIPASLVKGKTKVTVRFQATDGSQIAAVFGVRMVRADQIGT